MDKAYNWYSTLIKPAWAPPSWIFGPVWSVLYVLIAISFGKVFLMFFQKRIPFIVVLPFILNLVFNFSFTYFNWSPIESLSVNLLAAAIAKSKSPACTILPVPSGCKAVVSSNSFMLSEIALIATTNDETGKATTAALCLLPAIQLLFENDTSLFST